ncbi:MAG: hypothetical protein ACRYGL_11330 [Janthinobacterium lividum]
MSEAHHVLWTFLPGQREVDSFAYLDDVRLALREIRLAGVRSITQIQATEIVPETQDPVVKTYSLPLAAPTCLVLMTCAATWLQHEAGRSLRVAAGHSRIETAAAGDVEKLLNEALAQTSA